MSTSLAAFTRRGRTIRPRHIGLALVGAFAAVVTGGAAVAITSGSFIYDGPQTGYLSIHPMALHPSNTRSADDFDTSFFAAELTSQSQDMSCFSTGIHLPHRTRLLEMKTFYASGATSDVAVYLLRDNLASGVSDLLVSQAGDSDSGARTSVRSRIAAGVSTVRNDRYAYGFGVCLEDGDSFQGARITYRYESAGD